MAERMPNDEQKQVINETSRNILLFASAGTGKITVHPTSSLEPVSDQIEQTQVPKSTMKSGH